MVKEDIFEQRKPYQTPAILIKHISFADIIVTSGVGEPKDPARPIPTEGSEDEDDPFG